MAWSDAPQLSVALHVLACSLCGSSAPVPARALACLTLPLPATVTFYPLFPFYICMYNSL